MKAHVVEGRSPILPPGWLDKSLFPSDLGEVDTLGISDDSPLLLELLKIGRTDLDVQPQAIEPYLSPCVMYLRGSTHLHDDPGAGLCLNWLVYNDHIPYHRFDLSSPALYIQNRPPIKLALGDVFIFDADRQHAWVSNNDCVLIQVSVSTSRAKPIQSSTR